MRLVRILLIMAILVPIISVAKTYKYVDKNGVVVITDDFESIPDDLKKKATIIDDEKAKETQPTSSGSVENKPNEGIEKKVDEEKELKKSLFDYIRDSVVKKVILLVVLVALFIFAGVLLKGTENRRVVRLIRFGILIIIGIILFQAYLDKAEQQYEELKSDVERLKAHSIKRVIKNDEILK